jgi:hypothetical protein
MRLHCRWYCSMPMCVNPATLYICMYNRRVQNPSLRTQEIPICSGIPSTELVKIYPTVLEPLHWTNQEICICSGTPSTELVKKLPTVLGSPYESSRSYWLAFRQTLISLRNPKVHYGLHKCYLIHSSETIYSKYIHFSCCMKCVHEKTASTCSASASYREVPDSNFNIDTASPAWYLPWSSSALQVDARIFT